MDVSRRERLRGRDWNMFLVNKYKQIKAKSDHLTRAEQIRQIQEAKEEEESSTEYLDLQEIFNE